MSAYYETISASSPHIYHSALALAPETSIVRKLYKSHAQPFVRVIHGLPVSWDAYAAATTRPSIIYLVAWSPCSRFVAIISSPSVTTVHILDSVTLQKLQQLEFEFSIGDHLNKLIFSPDGHMLTSSGNNWREFFIVSWDLRTGSAAGVIRWESQTVNNPGDIAYSATGKMVAVAIPGYDKGFTSISICDVVSCEHLRDVQLPSNWIDCKFWSFAESLRVATLGRMASKELEQTPSITVWEIGFAAGTVSEVETLPVPESVIISKNDTMCFPQSAIHTQSPQSPRPIALVYHAPHEGVLVWDAQNSEILLNRYADGTRNPTFSSDGHFFAYSTPTEVHLWKDSPTNYRHHGKLAIPTAYCRSLLSPNGESVIVYGNPMITLWHTRNLATTPSDTPTHRSTTDFLVEFHPDRPLAAAVRRGDSMVTFLDLGSSAPPLVIDTGVEVLSLGVAGETVVLIDKDGATTAKLPAGTDAGMDRLDCVRVISLDDGSVVTGVLSPNSRYIIVVVASGMLSIYCATSGECLCGGEMNTGIHWFTPDSHSIGYLIHEDEGIVREIRTIVTGGTLQHQLGGGEIVDVRKGQWGCPFTSSRGYQNTKDGWVFCPSGKRLLILPPLWRLGSRIQWKWNGQFLALLHGELPDPVILELEPS